MEQQKIDSLMKQVALGDTLYLKEIYLEFKDHIFHYVLSVVKETSSSEDIMQETFLAVAKYANTYRIGTNFKAWIFKIAKNLINRHFTGQIKSLDIDELCDQLASEDYKLEEEDYHSLRALDKLETTEREIVILYVYEELSQVTIAKILNMSYISVRSKYANAMKKLKHYYRKERPNEK